MRIDLPVYWYDTRWGQITFHSWECRPLGEAAPLEVALASAVELARKKGWKVDFRFCQCVNTARERRKRYDRYKDRIVGDGWWTDREPFVSAGPLPFCCLCLSRDPEVVAIGDVDFSLCEGCFESLHRRQLPRGTSIQRGPYAQGGLPSLGKKKP